MSDVDDLLGDAPAKKTAKKAAPKVEVAAKKTVAVKEDAPVVAKKATFKAEVEAPARAPKEPIVFEDGEREALAKRIKQAVRKPWNSKDLADKLGVPTRKLRTVLYSMQKRDEITLEPGASKVTGMTVSPA